MALFAQAGFECLDIRAHDQEIENRKRDLIMSRRWVQVCLLCVESFGVVGSPGRQS